MLSKRPNTIMSVLVQKMYVCVSLPVCVSRCFFCVSVCMYMCSRICAASLQEEESEASPLLSAALIYLAVDDVILSGGLPC